LLPLLAAAAKDLNGNSLLSRRYCRSPNAEITIEGNLVTLETNSNESIMECQPGELEVLRWIADRPHPFTETQIVANGFAMGTVLSVVGALIELDMLVTA
jgi:hypothetical protein